MGHTLQTAQGKTYSTDSPEQDILYRQTRTRHTLQTAQTYSTDSPEQDILYRQPRVRHTLQTAQNNTYSTDNPG